MGLTIVQIKKNNKKEEDYFRRMKKNKNLHLRTVI